MFHHRRALYAKTLCAADVVAILFTPDHASRPQFVPDFALLVAELGKATVLPLRWQLVVLPCHDGRDD